MTVDNDINRSDYDPDGIVTIFSYDFRIDEASDLVVYEDGVVVDSGYTVSGVGETGGGDVTFDTAPLETVEILTLIREVPITQGTAFPTLGPFPAESCEAALDRLTFIAQQQQEELGRAVIAPIDSSADYTPPDYEAGGFWVWDILEEKLVTSVVLEAGTVRKATDSELLSGDEAATDAFVDPNQLKRYASTSVDSIADLRAITYTPEDGQTIDALGYYIPGDGGGQPVYWDGTSTATDNGFSIFKVSAISIGRFLSVDTSLLNVRHAGATGDGVTDDSAFILAADRATTGKLHFPAGNYRVESTLKRSLALGSTCRTWTGDGGYSSIISWYGATGGTLIEFGEQINTNTTFEKLAFDGRNTAGKLIHVGKSTSARPVARNVSVDNCIFYNNNSGTGIWLGDYTDVPATGDADIAQFNLSDSVFFDNENALTWDSFLALDINIAGCFMSRSGAGQFIKEAINMVRGGSAAITDSYFGGQSSTGGEHAVYVKDGWVNLSKCEIEYGVGSAGDSFIYFDTPVLTETVTGAPSSIIGCRVSGPGLTGTSAYVTIASANHPLVITSSTFTGKSGSGLTTNAINNPGGSKITSIGNHYTGIPWGTTTGLYVTSMSDTEDDGTTETQRPGQFQDIDYIDLKGNKFSGISVSIDDDNVESITPPRVGGFFVVTCNGDSSAPQSSSSNMIFYDTGSSLQITKGVGFTSSILDVTTSDVTGTTGTDGNTTIAVQSGVIKIENRQGATRNFQVTFL